MKHLPPVFTWNDWLLWAEEVSPEAKLEEVTRLFDVAASLGAIRPVHVTDKGEFAYELQPTVNIKVVEVAYFKTKEKNK